MSIFFFFFLLFFHSTFGFFRGSEAKNLNYEFIIQESQNYINVKKIYQIELSNDIFTSLYLILLRLLLLNTALRLFGIPKSSC